MFSESGFGGLVRRKKRKNKIEGEKSISIIHWINEFLKSIHVHGQSKVIHL